MAINVKLKNKDDVIHPETDWSVVVNKPSIYDKAYALDKPDYIVPSENSDGSVNAMRFETRVSFGLIEIVSSNRSDRERFQSFYIVTGRRRFSGPVVGSGGGYVTTQKLYYLFNSLSGEVKWVNVDIAYSESTTEYSYISDGVTYTVYLTPLLKK